MSLFTSLIPPQYVIAARLLAIGIVLVAVGLFGFEKGIDHEQVRLEAYQASVAAASTQAANHVVKIEADQAAFNQETHNEYQTQLSAVDTYYRGLLAHSSHGAQPSAGPGAAAGGIASVSGNGLAAGGSAGQTQPVPTGGTCDTALAQLMLQAADVTLQLEQLQAWVRGQARISAE